MTTNAYVVDLFALLNGSYAQYAKIYISSFLPIGDVYDQDYGAIIIIQFVQ